MALHFTVVPPRQRQPLNFKALTPMKLVPLPKRNPIEAQVNASGPALFDINIDEVTHLKGGSAANGDNSDSVVMQGSAEVAMRRLIAEFGFDRLPLTFGEFHGLRDYCLLLDGVAGTQYDGRAKKVWQGAALHVFSKNNPEHAEAFKLYAGGDREGLRKLHREQNTLVTLGKQFKQFDASE